MEDATLDLEAGIKLWETLEILNFSTMGNLKSVIILRVLPGRWENRSL